MDGGIMSDEFVEVVVMGKKSCCFDYIFVLKVIKKIKRSLFIVVDIEVVFYDDVYVFCVVGFLVVKLGEDFVFKFEYYIEIYFSEDNDFLILDFKKWSECMMFDFIECLVVVVLDEKEIWMVYFYNFLWYDGIIVMRVFIF